jgi:hypothetical protein
MIDEPNIPVVCVTRFILSPHTVCTDTWHNPNLLIHTQAWAFVLAILILLPGARNIISAAPFDLNLGQPQWSERAKRYIPSIDK